MKADVFALDAEASNRSFDDNGYLHVKGNRLTQDQVAGYLGREIPDWEERGLEPERIYYAWRNPEEIEKALSTFNGIPLLIKHQMDSADNPLKELRVGTVGSNARWEAPYLINDLDIWDKDAIKAIEDGSLRDLSCGYRYTPEWKSGETPDGLAYDFIMRDIKCNHVALVADGRAPDCFVNDSLPKELKMEEEVKVEAVEANDDFTEFARSVVEGLNLSPEQKDEIVRAFAEAHAKYEQAEEQEAEREVEGTRDENEVEAEAEEVTEDADEVEAETEIKEEAEDACAKDEDEPEEKKNDAMDANAIANIVREEMRGRAKAGEEVKRFIGAVDVFAYDSKENIYADAVYQITGKKVPLKSARDVFRAVSALKSNAMAMDSASKPSGVMAYLASKLNK